MKPPVPPSAVPVWTDAGAGRWCLVDRPGGVWLFCLFFVVAGGLGAFASIAALIASPGPEPLVTALISTAAIAAGVVGIDQVPRTRVHVDTQARRVTIERRGLRRQDRTLPFAEIREVALATDRDADGDEVVRPMIVLNDGACVPLSMPWQRDRAAVQHLADTLRQWLRP